MYTGFAFAVVFLFFAAFPFILSRPPYSFTVSQNGLFFLGIGLGVLLAGLTSILIDRYVYQAAHKRASVKGNAHARPEHRLYSAMLGSLGIPVGLFWFAWSADNGVHWIVPCIATVPFAWGNLCLFVSQLLSRFRTPVLTHDSVLGIALSNRRLRPVQRSVGDGGERLSPLFARSRLSPVRSSESVLAHCFKPALVLTCAAVYQRLGIGWATSLLGFLSVAMLPIPWVLFKWGPKIRKRSRYPVVM